MKPSEQLKEIEERLFSYSSDDINGAIAQLVKDKYWLIARVKRLTEALDKRHEWSAAMIGDGIHSPDCIACKALEEE